MLDVAWWCIADGGGGGGDGLRGDGFVTRKRCTADGDGDGGDIGMDMDTEEITPAGPSILCGAVT